MLCQEAKRREERWEEENQHAAWFTLSVQARIPALSPVPPRVSAALSPTKPSLLWLCSHSQTYQKLLSHSGSCTLATSAGTVVLRLFIQNLHGLTGEKSYWELHVRKTAQVNDSPGLQVSSNWSLTQSKISTQTHQHILKGLGGHEDSGPQAVP